ncbi:myozenin-1-like [Denticeps clupeoides]|uniref:Myozenin 1 n=1 Tax=Denticeps clupeoides TaxID=299321 RepID=A0AAY4C522_9TELE|nr:LOW QUALITY PROTEIN: myozenin-1-like [Denticeps clupeoides]XP_028810792.1 myozenin-1-like [Denticeps clupeoides]
MPFPTPAPANKRKAPSKIITDLSNISQEVQNDSDQEQLDLGTKIKTPKDVMLEELSLMKNKGSRMFQMRQQRVEKFIVSEENLNLQNLALPVIETPPPVPPKPAQPAHEEEDAEALKQKKRREYVKTYISPWERAMKGDEELRATMQLRMPGPREHKDLPKYKSFNRMAAPFGGFDKASKMLTFEIPELKQAEEEPDPVQALQFPISSRPSFNRTPIGWVCSEGPTHIAMELDAIPFDGETDDL